PFPLKGLKVFEVSAERLFELFRNCCSKLCGNCVRSLPEPTVLVKMGYGGTLKDAGQAIGGSGDEGIDGIIKEDRLGLDIIYIQAKKWEATVSRPEIQKFAGALQGKRARKGIFITTSDFSSGSREYVSHIDSKIILIDGVELATYMMDFGVGVSTEAVYELKRLDSDFFTDT
ncbi:MAG: restriction endonuclease, partial [Prosthecochloris sp.]|nr:restriction endonuclease [Prosthecochloris sp.]